MLLLDFSPLFSFLFGLITLSFLGAILSAMWNVTLSAYLHRCILKPKASCKSSRSCGQQPRHMHSWEMLLPLSVATAAFVTKTDSREVLFGSTTHLPGSVTSSLLGKLMIISSEADFISSSVIQQQLRRDAVHSAALTACLALRAGEMIHRSCVLSILCQLLSQPVLWFHHNSNKLIKWAGWCYISNIHLNVTWWKRYGLVSLCLQLSRFTRRKNHGLLCFCGDSLMAFWSWCQFIWFPNLQPHGLGRSWLGRLKKMPLWT